MLFNIKTPSTNILVCSSFRYTIAPNCAQACVTVRGNAVQACTTVRPRCAQLCVTLRMVATTCLVVCP